MTTSRSQRSQMRFARALQPEICDGILLDVPDFALAYGTPPA
ncbi:hypothetical protein [Rhizobium sp. NZLR8]|nr:hypothetical protein [Rhizobium sp. NZLR8]